MRLTVGPLPPAVYWRRRVVVLGAGLLFLIVVLYSCGGSGNSTAKQSASPTPTVESPSSPVLTPETGAPPADSGPPPPPADAPAPTTDTPSVSAPAPPAGSSCTDAEMSVTPVPSQTSAKRGATIDLQLKIKNISQRTCSRDVGPDPQEIYIKLGAQTVWSSDTCSISRGSRIESFTPGFERTYQVSWNGKDAGKCAEGVASGPTPNAGDYQVFGRLGAKRSDPVKLTITN
jgi:hypothetical protein